MSEGGGLLVATASWGAWFALELGDFLVATTGTGIFLREQGYFLLGFDRGRALGSEHVFLVGTTVVDRRWMDADAWVSWMSLRYHRDGLLVSGKHSVLRSENIFFVYSTVVDWIGMDNDAWVW